MPVLRAMEEASLTPRALRVVKPASIGQRSQTFRRKMDIGGGAAFEASPTSRLLVPLVAPLTNFFDAGPLNPAIVKRPVAFDPVLDCMTRKDFSTSRQNACSLSQVVVIIGYVADTAIPCYIFHFCSYVGPLSP